MHKEIKPQQKKNSNDNNLYAFFIFFLGYGKSGRNKN
jgi:hypothetical protein